LNFSRELWAHHHFRSLSRIDDPSSNLVISKKKLNKLSFNLAPKGCNRLKIKFEDENEKKMYNEFIVKCEKLHGANVYSYSSTYFRVLLIIDQEHIDERIVSCRQRQVSHLSSFDDKCGPLRSPLVTFLSVVGFILLRSLWWYSMCRNRSFEVPQYLWSLFFYFFFSF
jgi:hypothetical protein